MLSMAPGFRDGCCATSSTAGGVGVVGVSRRLLAPSSTTGDAFLNHRGRRLECGELALEHAALALVRAQAYGERQLARAPRRAGRAGRAARRARSAAGASPDSAPEATSSSTMASAGRRPLRHRHRDRPVELDDRRGRQPRQRLVEQHDPVPVGLLDRGRRPRGTRRSRPARRSSPGRARPARPGPARPRPRRIADRSHRRRSWSSSSTGVAVLVGAGREARGRQLEQREQPVHLGLVGHQARPAPGPAGSPRGRGRRGSARSPDVAVEPSVKIT